MAQAVKWEQLVRLPNPGTDISSAVQALVRTVRHFGPDLPDGRGFAKAIVKSLRSESNPDVLLACLAIQIVLESDAVGADLAALADDSVVNALGLLVSKQSALIVAASVRSFCSLVAAFPALVAADDRQAQFARRAVPLMKSALTAQPKALLVQEAVAQAACTLLAAGSWAVGSSAGALWSLLWPLAVHPQPRVSQPAALALARLTWTAKAPGASKGGAGAEVPSAETAIMSACGELTQLFMICQQQSSAPISHSSSAAAMAEVQCARLLELLQVLASLGHSVVASYGRKERGSVDDSLLVLPLGTLLNASNVLLTAAAQGNVPPLIVRQVLKLISMVVQIAGAAILPSAGQLRRWLILLIDAPTSLWIQQHVAILDFVSTLSHSCKAALVEAKLLERLVDHCLHTLRRIGEGAAPTTVSSGAAGDKKQKKGRRKRSADEAFRSIGSSRGGLAALHGAQATAIGSPEDAVQRVRTGCLMLALLLRIGAPMISPSQVGGICEQVVRVVWLGVLAPRGSLASSEGELQTTAVCEELCRDRSAALALVELIAALLQPPRIPVVRLAPKLTDAFVLVLDTLASLHRHRACAPRAHSEAAAGLAAGGGAVVAATARVKEEVLLLAAAAVEGSAASEGAARHNIITISWPEAAAVSSSAVVPTDGMEGSPEVLQDHKLEREEQCAELTAQEEQLDPRKEPLEPGASTSTCQQGGVASTPERAGQAPSTSVGAGLEVAAAVVTPDVILQQPDEEDGRKKERQHELHLQELQQSPPQQSPQEQKQQSPQQQQQEEKHQQQHEEKQLEQEQKQPQEQQPQPQDHQAMAEEKLELFPLSDEGSPLPPLCTDSPDSDA